MTRSRTLFRNTSGLDCLITAGRAALVGGLVPATLVLLPRCVPSFYALLVGATLLVVAMKALPTLEGLANRLFLVTALCEDVRFATDVPALRHAARRWTDAGFSAGESLAYINAGWTLEAALARVRPLFAHRASRKGVSPIPVSILLEHRGLG